MGLLDQPVAALGDRLGDWRHDGAMVSLSEPTALGDAGDTLWPRGATLVLKSDTAVELGHPGQGSLSLLLWTDHEMPDLPRGVARIGPDLTQLRGQSVALGRVILVEGRFDDNFKAYQDLHDAVFRTTLQGVSLRSRPSSGQVWMRVSTQAVDRGLSLGHLGAAVCHDLMAVDAVRSASVIWICDRRQVLEHLRPVAEMASRLVAAMIKRRTEDLMDCDRCEYNDICDEGMPP